MALVLHSAPNKNAYKALVAAEYSGVKVELVKNFEMGVSNKTPEFIKMNPIGKIPVLETPDGRYLKAMRLHAMGHIEQWIDFAATEIDVSLGNWLYPRLGYRLYLPPAEEAAIASLKRALGALNTHLASNTYLVGHGVTIADIVMVCNLAFGFKTILTKSFTSEFPHVERIYSTVASKKPAQPKESAKPKKEEAKKEVKKEEVKPKEVVEDEEAPKPKAKNPLDLLPPSKMILDEWKRLYSNTKTNFREVAIKVLGFWDMYDPEGYSLWFCDYKYNDENTVSFVTLNKVSGFLQRMDLARKYAFGKMLIIGEAPYKVKGLWLFRGTEIPQFVLDECYDMELYEWKKVDISDEAQKERVIR
ncbi:UNVERIFIED_CONTAM: Elongation factor 1-gamma 2 [Sesamum calycinum]|uniref:Elongation factor 1-gamma 2 n=1 Tax=Sesamum calycinum TaxID=2727403 RepID=A0AAW2P8S9_9LAMI